MELTSRFVSSKTKFIGISTSFWYDNNIPDNINEFINDFRQLFPGIKIIFGGARADSEFLKSVADMTIVGEAENKLLELIKGHNVFKKFDITTLAHRFTEKDCIVDGEVLPIELGRGCIFKCKFCGHHNLGKPKNTYQRCFHEIESEIIYNHEKFKTSKYMFLDDTVNEDIDKVKNLSLIPEHTGVNIQWTGYLRADLLWSFEDSPEMLLKSGLKSCFFGIETFNKKAATSIGKGWSSKHGKTFLKELHTDIWDKKINIWNNFIIGLPHESRKDLEDTLEWCLENPMGEHKFVGLNLYSNRTDTGGRSEFSKNPELHGYSFNSFGKWKNDHFDQDSAVDLCNEFNSRINSAHKNKMSSWQLFDLINCGINIDTLMMLPSSAFNSISNLPFKSFLKKYTDSLKKL
jgi:radical SAM superfamily enzyme YgiQ (UPF0313 family)